LGRGDVGTSLMCDSPAIEGEGEGMAIAEDHPRPLQGREGWAVLQPTATAPDNPFDGRA